MAQLRRKILLIFGKRIKKSRLSLGISQEELGFRCNLDRTYISGIERGVRNPSLTVLFRLAQGLGLSLSVLFEELDPETIQQNEENKDSSGTNSS